MANDDDKLQEMKAQMVSLFEKTSVPYTGPDGQSVCVGAVQTYLAICREQRARREEAAWLLPLKPAEDGERRPIPWPGGPR